jgi:hypothetical protein
MIMTPQLISVSNAAPVTRGTEAIGLLNGILCMSRLIHNPLRNIFPQRYRLGKSTNQCECR